MPHPVRRAALLACLAAGALPAQAQTTPAAPAPAPAAATQTIEVVGTSPLPGQGVARDDLPYNTTVVRRGQLDEAQAANLSDHLARRLPGVQVNDIQGSPFQGDLTFRGFRASGLLGAAQGLSVYLDGVRINEPFGDVVNWDMVPEFSLDSVSLVPGANPAFGLNTLGGAVALTTATGRSAPGWRAEASLGQFGRQRLDVSHGGATDDGWDHYIALGRFQEDGWRDFSEGDLTHALAKLSRSTDLGTFGASLLLARSSLVGNGLVPLYTLDEDTGERVPDIGAGRREAVYTHPDLTRNDVSQLSLTWRHSLDERTSIEALAFVRDSERSTVNGDEADEAEGDANASFNRTATDQRSAGVSLAVSGRHGAHRWQAGASFERASVGYQQTEQEGTFTPDRGVQALDEPAELSVDVSGRSRTLGVYATDTWQLMPGTHLTGTLRYNEAKVVNTLITRDDDTGVLEAKPTEAFTYRNWNPALGLAHKVGASGVTLFGNVARNTRVPTVIELGCADPAEPCRLPIGLQADPYLKPVVSTTFEGGLRFGAGKGPKGSVTLFRTDNRDDILFRSVSVTGQLGYFQNFPRTRNQGVDAEGEVTLGPVRLSLGLSLLDATYQAEGTLRAGERNVQVRPGTRVAGLPRQMLKAGADWTVGGGWSVGLDMQAFSGRTVAGNEDGVIEDAGDEPVDLTLPGYALVNLQAAWKPSAVKGLEVFARVTNLFDRRYATFGALAETQFDAQGNYVGEEADAVFVAPGAPRAFTVGLRMRW